MDSLQASAAFPPMTRHPPADKFKRFQLKIKTVSVKTVTDAAFAS